MSRLIRTSTAERDLVEIGLHIAQDNIAAAVGVLDSIEAHLHAIAAHPFIGEACQEFGPDVRRSSTGNYVIYYRPVGDEIIIVRVLHGARDKPGNFK